MNTQATDTGGKGGGEASTTIGVGGVTSGQSGATPSHETQRETGGSGGEPLTKDDGTQEALAPAAKSTADPAPAGSGSEAADSSMQSRSRGAFDTRPDQGGGTGTGIGSPESGANQSESDLSPQATQQRGAP